MIKKLLLIIIILLVSVINVKATDFYGDVNGDGKVAVNDYVLIRKHILKLYSLNDSELKRADVNNDGKINTTDYIEIRKIILYKTDLVPVPTTAINSSYDVTKDFVVTTDFSTTGKSYSSKTLKYKVIKANNGNIYYALIWVEDAYNQLNCGNSGYTKQLKEKHFSNEIKDLKLEKKGMIGTNGGFALDDRDNIPLLATKGVYKVNDKYATKFSNGKNAVYLTLSIDKNSKLIYKKLTNADEAKTWYEKKGVRNAWGISSFTKSADDTTTNDNSDMRTQICQIDKHNFVMAVGYTDHLMQKLHNTFGCIAVANMDGGGSTGMYYKTNTASSVSAIYKYKRPSESTYRSNVDIMYFYEK